MSERIAEISMCREHKTQSRIYRSVRSPAILPRAVLVTENARPRWRTLHLVVLPARPDGIEIGRKLRHCWEQPLGPGNVRSPVFVHVTWVTGSGSDTGNNPRGPKPPPISFFVRWTADRSGRIAIAHRMHSDEAEQTQSETRTFVFWLVVALGSDSEIGVGSDLFS